MTGWPRAFGTIPALAEKARWDGSDVYVSGPDAMIVAAVEALRDLGADPALVRYDLPEKIA
jgi:NAD(P)H-flavin reductase